jgi:hypothetical protein
VRLLPRIVCLGGLVTGEVFLTPFLRRCHYVLSAFRRMEGSRSIRGIANESAAKASDTAGASSLIYFTRVAARECVSITGQSST